MKKVQIALAVVLVCTQVQAQDLKKATEYYKSGFYAEAIQQTQGYRSGDAEAVRTMAALQLKAENAEAKARAFLKQHHENVNVPQVRFLLAQNLFDEGRYEDAAQELHSIEPAHLNKAQLPEYRYKLGYSAYSCGDWETARELLPQNTLEYSNHFSAFSKLLCA